LQLVLDKLCVRYSELPEELVREHALEVMRLADPDRLSPPLLVQLVEARLLALI
jgi:hypothetical protein